jgi:hypothetical protein
MTNVRGYAHGHLGFYLNASGKTTMMKEKRQGKTPGTQPPSAYLLRGRCAEIVA